MRSNVDSGLIIAGGSGEKAIRLWKSWFAQDKALVIPEPALSLPKGLQQQETRGTRIGGGAGGGMGGFRLSLVPRCEGPGAPGTRFFNVVRSETD